MHGMRVFAVVLVVVLAGCSGFLGGDGGTDTPTATNVTDGTSDPADGGDGSGDSTTGSSPTATDTADGTGTATSEPPNDTSPATETPMPDDYETVTVENASLGTRLELTGNASAVGTARTGNMTGAVITRGGVLQCARASPFVGVVTNGTVADTTVTMDYDPSRLPANASESDLAVFAFNRTVQFYLEMNTTVDAANDSVVATEVRPGQTFRRETENGTTEVLAPAVDGTRLDNVFVVMHSSTYWEGYRTGEVPARCETGS